MVKQDKRLEVLLKQASLAKKNYEAFSIFINMTEDFIEPDTPSGECPWRLWLDMEIINATILEEYKSLNGLKELFNYYLRDIVLAIDLYVEMMITEDWIKLNLPPLPLKTLDFIVLSQDVPEFNLTQGTKGLVIDVYQNDGDLSYEVEFIDESGQILAQLEVKGDYLKKAN
jgi:hypothetical protein